MLKLTDRFIRSTTVFPPHRTAGQESNRPDVAAVKAVLVNYKSALENLDAAPAATLFTPSARVFESGGVEGSYADYLRQHVDPVFREFKQLTYADYNVDVCVDLPYAFTTEIYICRIVLKHGGRVLERRGVTTSILKKFGSEWKIIQAHTSCHALPRRG